MASTALVKLREQVAAIKGRHSKAVQHARRGFKVLGDAAVIGGSAALWGGVQGRYGAVKLPHTQVPVDLVFAAGFYVTGLMEPFGEGASHTLFNIGHGTLASHLTAVGRGAGKRMRAKAGKPPLMEGAADSDVSSLLEGMASGGGTISDDDLVNLAKRV
jgi:hypothetical protein